MAQNLIINYHNDDGDGDHGDDDYDDDDDDDDDDDNDWVGAVAWLSI